MADLGYMAPMGAEILLSALAVLILLIGLFIRNSSLMGYLSLAGLVAALGMVLSSITSPTVTLLFDTLSVDSLSQFFKATFLVVSLLVVVASFSRYKDSPGAMEFYALLLLATVGMMVVSSAIDLITLFV
ncbi:MAG TPA: NADH-quinone oxidoreductase subunit N, partial [Methanotrichaceae archaeon]|nr:NADH-quinone oxidoreductase subunit N [Methanotrichaceae archaeon]